MNLLLDTHTLLWTVTGDPKLSRQADKALHDEDALIYVSAASVWEIATKFRLGKLPEAEILIEDFSKSLRRLDFMELPVSVNHAQRAGLLPGSHRDPFDRLLIAQAQAENLVLVSNERVFDSYGIRRLW